MLVPSVLKLCTKEPWDTTTNSQRCGGIVYIFEEKHSDTWHLWDSELPTHGVNVDCTILLLMTSCFCKAGVLEVTV